MCISDQTKYAAMSLSEYTPICRQRSTDVRDMGSRLGHAGAMVGSGWGSGEGHIGVILGLYVGNDGVMFGVMVGSRRA